LRHGFRATGTASPHGEHAPVHAPNGDRLMILAAVEPGTMVASVYQKASVIAGRAAHASV